MTQPRAPHPCSARTHAPDGRVLLIAALLLVLLLHGALLFNGSYLRSYDALIHTFFGAHYVDSWFDPWEPRWYTGFLTIAYPPLSHMLIALLAPLGLLTAFAAVQLGALLGLTVGLYRFATLLVGARAAGYAALALAISSSLAETVHVFGQLPTTLSLGLLLNALPFVVAWLRQGRRSDLIKAIAFTAATTAAHHVTTLFGSVFFTGPLVVMVLLAGLRAPRPDEPQGDGSGARFRRRLYRLAPRAYRTGVFGVLAIATLVVVVLPYWIWSGTDPILQVAIPHGSRADFLAEPNLGLVFWVIPWFSTLWALPYLIYRGAGRLWPVAASALLLALLGTGGTTPLPRLLLRGAFDILTLDRFTFWATILILPFVGAAIESALHGRLRRALDANLGQRVRWLIVGGMLLAGCVAVVAISTLTRYRRFQPDPIDIAPIVAFLEKDQHWRYRYLTLGFGDQMAWLAANTRATTPDGNYHSARRLPELTTTPVERLEGAKYTGVPGLGSLERFLSDPEVYHLKFVLSNDAFYDPLLAFHGWHRLDRLENGIVVWEREDIPPLPARLPRRVLALWQRLLWGALPPAAALTALLSLLLPRGPPPPRREVAPWRVRLLREDALPPRVGGHWLPLRGLRGLGARLRRRVPLRRRRRAARWALALLLAAAAALPAGLALTRARGAGDTPERAVIAYWDHLDFRRYDAAFGLLEPAVGLDLERWLLERSLAGGLRSGYAKLDAIEPELVAYRRADGRPADPAAPPPAALGDEALVASHLTWLTPLAYRSERIEQTLLRTPQGWRIRAAPQAAPRDPAEIVADAAVTWYRSPRRLLDVDATTPEQRLDRPRVEVEALRLVRYRAVKTPLELEAEAVFSGRPEAELAAEEMRWALIGEVRNLGPRPADITVTGVLRSADGVELARANPGTRLVTKLLSGEASPFRIDFEAVDFGAPGGDGAPPVASGDVFARGVVSARRPGRDLVAWSRPTAGGAALELRLDNVGAVEATVPHALVALYDETGIAWLAEAFGLDAVPPRGARPLTLALGLPDGYAVVWSDGAPPGADTALLEHPSLTGYRVTVHAFERTER